MKSIIFNQHQVNHALKNKEGMFRVVVKPQPNSSINPVYLKEINSWQWATKESRRKPKFEVGQEIFVKEAFGNYYSQVWYKSDYNKEISDKYFWKPARHMKQERSRITLRIKSVKVERLQDISEEGCWKEGFLTDANYSPFRYFDKLKKKTAEQKFISHWNSTHKKPEEKWGANPWVWCYEYEVVR